MIAAYDGAMNPYLIASDCSYDSSYLGKIDATALIGVGAAFDFHAGTKARAPAWMQRSGLEWLFRLACEPRRLARRYLVDNALFLGFALQQVTGLKSYAHDW